MATRGGNEFSIQTSRLLDEETGIFTWNLERNILFADAAVAALFGLPSEATTRGLPLEAYLARVHPVDRGPMARVISEAIIAEVPQRDTYRVQRADGVYAMVAVFGRAFRDEDDSPVLYSGIIVAVPESNNSRH